MIACPSRRPFESNRARRDDRQRLNRKLALTRELYRRGFDRDRIIRLFRFLDFLMRLPEPLAIQYRKEVESIEGEANMPYVTSVERLARKEGRAEGRREDVIEALEIRFGEIPYAMREAINRVGSAKELKRLHRLAITVKSLDEFTI